MRTSFILVHYALCGISFSMPAATPEVADERDRQVLESTLLHLLAADDFDIRRVPTEPGRGERPPPNTETVRERLSLLKGGISRQEAESLLGLNKPLTNDVMIWKYSISTNQWVYLRFSADWDFNRNVYDTEKLHLKSATLDWPMVTNRLGLLRAGMRRNEVEGTLGIRAPRFSMATSGMVFFTYDFAEPADSTNLTNHDLEIGFHHPWPDPEGPADWGTSTNLTLGWVDVDGVSFHPGH